MRNLDSDLSSIAETRCLVESAYQAGSLMAHYDQVQVHRIIKAIAQAGIDNAEILAEMAVRETGYGVCADKVLKNRFAAENVLSDILNQSLVGIIHKDFEHRYWEVATPMGVVAAIIPSTNPTSTTIFKTLISLAGRNTIVFSPHPSAITCISTTAEICYQAALNAGAPEGCIGWITNPTLQGTTELMRHHHTAVILATGGTPMVKAAYSSGKPAYGVGPGNVPAYVDRSADVKEASRLILAGKCFDNGTICASEQAIVADQPITDDLKKALVEMGAYFIPKDQLNLLENLATPGGKLNPRVVGQSAESIAQWAGIEVPSKTRCLIVELDGVGTAHPLSCEKLSPILAFYTASDWQTGCERCLELLAYGGQGHTLVIHARDEAVIEQFALEKPVGRLLVNASGSQGAIGLTTNLTPSLTLGCGSAGGNITTDNITARHLIQIRRVAFGLGSDETTGSGGLDSLQLAAKISSQSDGNDDTVCIKETIRQALLEEGYW